ncbi:MULTISPECIES: hypothetical protein [unclassified Bradyrhizobium]|uniref:hypothetical protein n=1 Tax=unclassified Bradyrhizobium TaxID=2631580 RepID=UPI0010093C4D|nr:MULTISPECIES: hypothetical protein [unclassified Bradyrhizobium]
MVAPTRVLPASGFVLEVDGQFKTEYASKDGAWSKAEELKRRRPMLQVEIYDAVRKAREEVRLPPG